MYIKLWTKIQVALVVVTIFRLQKWQKGKIHRLERKIYHISSKMTKLLVLVLGVIYFRNQTLVDNEKKLFLHKWKLVVKKTIAKKKLSLFYSNTLQMCDNFVSLTFFNVHYLTPFFFSLCRYWHMFNNGIWECKRELIIFFPTLKIDGFCGSLSRKYIRTYT